jgi:hypothetical protein
MSYHHSKGREYELLAVHPLGFSSMVSYFTTRKPTQEEFDTCDRYELTYESPVCDPSGSWYAEQEAAMMDARRQLEVAEEKHPLGQGADPGGLPMEIPHQENRATYPSQMQQKFLSGKCSEELGAKWSGMGHQSGYGMTAWLGKLMSDHQLHWTYFPWKDKSQIQL